MDHQKSRFITKPALFVCFIKHFVHFCSHKRKKQTLLIMNFRSYLLALLAVFTFFSCGSSDENREDKLTATINGEEWEFFNVSVERTEEDVLEINADGYLEGDRGAIPSHLMMTIVGVPENEPINTPYELTFAPSTTGTAAHATIEPEGAPSVFDTQLDVNTNGVIVITEASDSQISGEFNFIATDQEGRRLEVENGRFNNLRY